MLSFTELMKHAEHCGFGCTPTLNHTGELNAIFCSTSKCISSSRKASREAASAKYPPRSPQRTMVLATRPISCRTDPSRSGVPGFPWKYLLVTMFVAVCDQLFGTSTSSWRKIVTPFSFPIRAVRFSHSTVSNGDFFPSVKYRWKTRPVPPSLAVFSTAVSVTGNFPPSACFTVAIRSSRALGLPLAGEPFYFTPLRPAEGPRIALGSGLKRMRSRFPVTKWRLHFCYRAKRQCSAVGRWVAHSLTAGAAPQMRARSKYFALGFFA